MMMGTELVKSKNQSGNIALGIGKSEIKRIAPSWLGYFLRGTRCFKHLSLVPWDACGMPR